MCYHGCVGKTTRALIRYDQKAARAAAGPRPRKCLVCTRPGIIYEIPVCATHYGELTEDEKRTAALGYKPGRPMSDSICTLVKGYLAAK